MTDSINTYVLSLIALSVTSGLLGAMLPENTGIRKYLRYLISLAALTVMLSPLFGLIPKIPELIDSIPEPSAHEKSSENEAAENTGFQQAVIRESVRQIELRIEEEVLQTFGCNLDISLQYDESDITAVRITGGIVQFCLPQEMREQAIKYIQDQYHIKIEK